MTRSLLNKNSFLFTYFPETKVPEKSVIIRFTKDVIYTSNISYSVQVMFDPKNCVYVYY